MVSLSLIGFKLFSEQFFYAPDHSDLDLCPADPKIDRDYLWVMTNYTHYCVPKLDRFQVNEQTNFILHVSMTFDLLTPKSIGIMFGSWSTKTPIIRCLR